MELRHLEAFYAAANEMHITRAAKRMKVAQSALTRQIKSLEKSLGCQLVQKNGRGITLTQAGLFLRGEAGGLLQAAEAIRKRTAAIGAGQLGHLSIGLSEGAAFTPRLAQCFLKFRKAHPEVEITFTQRRSIEIGSAIQQGDIDVAFTCPVSVENARFSVQSLSCDNMRLAVPLSHPFAKRESIHLSELKGESLIFVDHGDIPESLENIVIAACNDLGFSPKVVQSSPELVLALNLTAAGVGLAFAPEYMKTTRNDAVIYVQLESPVPLEAELVMVSRAEEKNLPLVSDLRRTAVRGFQARIKD